MHANTRHRVRWPLNGERDEWIRHCLIMGMRDEEEEEKLLQCRAK